MINKAKEYLGIGKTGKLALMDYYNHKCYPYVAANRKYKIKPTDEWCAMFTTVMANMCGVGSVDFPYEVSVFYQRKWAKEKGLFYTDLSKVKPNDLIIYDWKNNGTYDHVGFVVSINDGVIKAIEGNKGDTVAYRTLNANSGEIDGFISIRYDDKNHNKYEMNPSDRIAILAMRTVIGQYGNGKERRDSLGADFDAVQRLINMM